MQLCYSIVCHIAFEPCFSFLSTKWIPIHVLQSPVRLKQGLAWGEQSTGGHWTPAESLSLLLPCPKAPSVGAQHTLTSSWGTWVKCRQRICISRNEAGLGSLWKEFRAGLPRLRTTVLRKRWAGGCGALGVASWLWASIRPERSKIQSWKDTYTFPLPRSHCRLHDPTVSRQN